MIVYKRCTQVHEDDIFNAFQIGFSDYIIKGRYRLLKRHKCNSEHSYQLAE